MKKLSRRRFFRLTGGITAGSFLVPQSGTVSSAVSPASALPSEPLAAIVANPVSAEALAAANQVLNIDWSHFLGTMSPELRTPLCSIQMALRMLEQLLRESSGALPPEKWQRIQQYLQIAQRETQRENELVNDVITCGYALFVNDDSRLYHRRDTINLGSWLPPLLASIHQQCHSQSGSLLNHIPPLPPFEMEISPDLPIITSHEQELEIAIAALLKHLHSVNFYAPQPISVAVSMLQADIEGPKIQLRISTPIAELPTGVAVRSMPLYPDYAEQQREILQLQAAHVRVTYFLGGTIAVEQHQNQIAFLMHLPAPPIPFHWM